MMHALKRFLLFHLLACLGLHALGSEIIHGRKVPENEMTYMASVQNKAGDHVCGGFLINEDFVVTAAHCVDANPTSVVLGTHNLKKADHKMRYKVKTCKFPSYVNITKGCDIMLLKLSRKARLNRRLKRIDLPKTKIEIKDKRQCRVAGWGLTSDGKSVDELQMVDVPVVNPKDCKKQWPDLPLNVICAGGYPTNKGFCQGDSGGPLVCNGKAVGVVSYNKGNCDYPDVPNVYTNISKYLPWIRKILKKKNC
ncbi:mast cell protease 1A-like [Cottoperca gobio]|uniref:Mast cell protease 1A-like n=1 Tax=Cottoperca gobio TaxID=56716 RepID=A0A6J2PKU5_COTGO|nr:mast cell protease 1A-like [Cottoperca gobio]